MDQKQKEILDLIQNATAQLNALLDDVRDIKKTYDKEKNKRSIDTSAQKGTTKGIKKQKEEDLRNTQAQTRKAQGVEEQKETAGRTKKEKKGPSTNS